MNHSSELGNMMELLNQGDSSQRALTKKRKEKKEQVHTEFHCQVMKGKNNP